MLTMDSKAPLVLRAMTEEDLPQAIELSIEQEWPHRQEDWALFLQIGEGMVAECDGKIIGTVMAWRFGATFATIGMVIVAEHAQGRGIGRQLMDAILQRLEGMTVMLNATAEGAPLYTKLGFVEIGTVRQHQGIAPPMPLADLLPGERVRPMGATDDSMADLYSRATGMDRRALFDVLSANSSAVVLSRSHQPVGFALMRRFGRGWTIAPLVSPDLGGTKALVTHWLSAKVGTFCRLDVVAGAGVSRWLDEIGLPCVGTVTTMVRGDPPRTAPDIHVIGIAAQALG